MEYILARPVTRAKPIGVFLFETPPEGGGGWGLRNLGHFGMISEEGGEGLWGRGRLASRCADLGHREQSNGGDAREAGAGQSVLRAVRVTSLSLVLVGAQVRASFSSTEMTKFQSCCIKQSEKTLFKKRKIRNSAA